MVKQLALPRVHLNGTSANELVRLQCDAVMHLRKAQHAIRLASPHMRDYYMQEDGAAVFNHARAQHDFRLRVIDTIIEELTTIAMNVQDQKK